jgi:hypothetical protein
MESKIRAHLLWTVLLAANHSSLPHNVEMELQLANAIDLHPEISVNVSCQRMESVDEKQGPRQRVSPLLTTESPMHHFLKICYIR